MYFHRGSLGPVDLAFTAGYADGGGIDGERRVLDLGLGAAADLRRVTDDFAPGDRVAQMHQVHGAAVRVVDAGASAADDGLPEVDALVTAESGVVLVVRVADCVPVLLADPERGVIAAVHAGRPGLAAGVVPAAVERMHGLGAREVTAWVGPHVCGACYEVPAALRAEVGDLVPAAVSTTSWGTPSLDIGAGVLAQLHERADVVTTVQSVDACTREEPRLHSYRRDGAAAGRFAGLVRRRA